MDTAAARALHDRALGVAARLRLLAPGDSARVQLLLELADTAAQLRDAAASLSDAGSRDVWTKRHAWLRQEMATLAVAQLRGGGDEGDGTPGSAAMVVDVLEFCAARCKAAQIDAEAAQAALHAAAARAREVEAPAAHAVAAPSPRGQLQVLQARTELVLAQQELARRTADSSTLSDAVTALSEARAAAVARAEASEAELAEARTDVDRQADVIGHLMERTEEWSDAAHAAQQQAAALETDNGALRAAVAAQAATLERLLALNEELAERANARAAQRETSHAKQLAVPDEPTPPTPQQRRGWLSRAWGAGAYFVGMARGGGSGTRDVPDDAEEDEADAPV